MTDLRARGSPSIPAPSTPGTGPAEGRADAGTSALRGAGLDDLHEAAGEPPHARIDARALQRLTHLGDPGEHGARALRPVAQGARPRPVDRLDGVERVPHGAREVRPVLAAERLVPLVDRERPEQGHRARVPGRELP